jgi:hydrogenase 3 maturation protease
MDLTTLDSYCNGAPLVVGIGNRMRKDDGFGSIVAERIQKSHKTCALDTGVCPENYLGKISRLKPDTVILVDAADMGLAPGAMRIATEAEAKPETLFSTHNACCFLVMNFLKNEGVKDIIVVTVQPKDIGFGEGMSPELEKPLGDLVEWFNEKFAQKKR